jgi:hypothetical protein
MKKSYLDRIAEGDTDTVARILVKALSHPYSVNVDFGDHLVTWSKTGTAALVQGVEILIRAGVEPDTVRHIVEAVIANSIKNEPDLKDSI